MGPLDRLDAYYVREGPAPKALIAGFAECPSRVRVFDAGPEWVELVVTPEDRFITGWSEDFDSAEEALLWLTHG